MKKELWQVVFIYGSPQINFSTFILKRAFPQTELWKLFDSDHQKLLTLLTPSPKLVFLI